MELYPLIKYVVCSIGALVVCIAFSACGLSTRGEGIVLGTTSYLREANRTGASQEQHVEYSSREKKALNELIRRNY